MWSFRTGFFHLAWCFQDSFTMYHLPVLSMRHSSLCLENVPFYEYNTAFYLFISRRTWGCFHVLVIVNNATLTVYVQAFCVDVCIPCTWGGIAESDGVGLLSQTGAHRVTI